MNTLRYSTAVQQVNHPVHNWRPNPRHGQFFFVGSIPAECYDVQRGGSKFYPTEQAALDAAIAAGAPFVQGADCRIVHRAQS